MRTPPFTVSARAIQLVANISAQVECYAIRLEAEDRLRLHEGRMSAARKVLRVRRTS